MPESRNRLANLVKNASDDLTPETPIRRGRGLDGMIADGTSQPTNEPTSIQADMSTNQQVEKLASKQVSKQTSKASEDTPRTVKSYRIRDDLAYRIDVLAATERRKIYELVEEAFELYLITHDEEQRANAGS